MVSLPNSQSSRRSGAVATRWRVWVALFFRDAAGEEHNLGYVIRLIEPAILIMATVAIAWLVNRHPPYGNSMILFAVTGVAPIYLFAHISMQVSRVVAVKLPFHTDMDQCVVMGFIELFFGSMSILIFFAIIYWTQTPQAFPLHMSIAISSWLLLGMMGFGVGLVSRTLSRLYPFWEIAYPALARVLIHLSGVYYVVDNLPPLIRQYIVWNPLVHAVTWFRLGFYNSFPKYTFSLGYFFWWAFGSIVLGLTLEYFLGDRIRDR